MTKLYLDNNGHYKRIKDNIFNILFFSNVLYLLTI